MSIAVQSILPFKNKIIIIMRILTFLSHYFLSFILSWYDGLTRYNLDETRQKIEIVQNDLLCKLGSDDVSENIEELKLNNF
jgi:hypothetical protein